MARRRDGERGRAPRPQPLARGEISILERSHPSDNPAVPIAAGALGGPGPHPCTAQLCCGCDAQTDSSATKRPLEMQHRAGVLPRMLCLSAGSCTFEIGTEKGFLTQF